MPAVRLEEEFAKSPLKKLAFDFEKEIITDINYTRLDKAIENKFITLKYIIEDCMIEHIRDNFREK